MTFRLMRRANRGADKPLGIFDHVGAGWGSEIGDRITLRFRPEEAVDKAHAAEGDRADALEVAAAILRAIASLDVMKADHDPAVRRAARHDQGKGIARDAEAAVLIELQQKLGMR